MRMTLLSSSVPPSSGTAFISVIIFANCDMNQRSTIRLWSTPFMTGLWPRSCQLRNGLL